jgi:hypothetical protein
VVEVWEDLLAMEVRAVIEEMATRQGVTDIQEIKAQVE